MADFEDVSDQFSAYYDQVRGHVRERLTQENAREYLPPPPATVLDLGGGEGRDAQWLAEEGYSVTWVDPTPRMFELAAKRFQGLNLPVIQVHLAAEELETELGPQQFDVVLSHGVLMYCLDDPEAHIAAIARHAKLGAFVSVLTKGFEGAKERLAIRGDKAGIAQLEKTGQTVNNLGKRTWAYRPQQVHEMLKRHDLELIEWRGIRTLSDDDTRDIKNISSRDIEEILSAERYLGSQEGPRKMGQMLHYIARKV